MHLNRKNTEFIRLVEALQAPVYTLCYLLLGESPAAEQAAQESFTQAYVQFNPRSWKCNTQIWLLHIAYQQCQARCALSNGPTDQAYEGDSQFSNVYTAPIQSLLAKLEPEERAMIVLRFRYRLDLEAIAWVMGTDGETVKTRLRKAQKALAAQYCQEGLREPIY